MQMKNQYNICHLHTSYMGVGGMSVCYFDLCCGNTATAGDSRGLQSESESKSWRRQGVRVKFACQNQMRQFWQLAGLIICIQMIVMTPAMSMSMGMGMGMSMSVSLGMDLGSWPDPTRAGLKPHTKHMTLAEQMVGEPLFNCDWRPQVQTLALWMIYSQKREVPKSSSFWKHL